ncbi:hypothetical protein [Kitasatospora sp. LaBMicrA B282]|uniref:hypothetical protein n=1 Tax=Kitasatospora sp. LaBMicrA B282 TaxID=3420949 RepID=UPI003D0B57B0
MTLDNRPLYCFAGDANAGDIKGHNRDGFFLVGADGTMLPADPVVNTVPPADPAVAGGTAAEALVGAVLLRRRRTPQTTL